MLDHIQPILLLLEYPIINTVSICIMYAHTYFSSFFVPNAEKLELCKRIIYTYTSIKVITVYWLYRHIPNLFKEAFSDMVFSNVTVILQKHFGKSNFFPY